MKPLPRFGMVYMTFVAIACLVAFMAQSIPNFAELPLADYHHYMTAYDYFAGNLDSFEVRFPYNQRIFIPWLAAQLPIANPIHSFLLINLIITLVGAYFWLKIWQFLNFSQIKIIGITFFFLLHFAGWLRLHIFDPVTTDPAQMAIYAVGLYILLKRHYYYLIPFSILSLLIKESTIALLMAFLICGFLMRESKRNIVLIAIVTIIAFLGLLIINSHFAGLGTPSKGFLYSIYNNLSLLLSQPDLILRWLAALLVVFGGFPALVFSSRNNWNWDQADKILVITGLSILGLSLIGGQDYTRLIMFSAPLLLTFVIKNAGKENWKWILTLIGSLPLMYLLGRIPDPVEKREEFEALFPEYGVIEGIWPYLIYGVVVNLILVVIFHFLGRQSR
ncbi:hypothetical protein [Peijinzhouia sedimentorum]